MTILFKLSEKSPLNAAEITSYWNAVLTEFQGEAKPRLLLVTDDWRIFDYPKMGTRPLGVSAMVDCLDGTGYIWFDPGCSAEECTDHLITEFGHMIHSAIRGVPGEHDTPLFKEIVRRISEAVDER